jgi:hypothetical protein
MHSPDLKPLEDIEQSIELVSPIEILKGGSAHSGVHTKIAKILVLLSLLLLALSFANSAFVILSFGVFCLAIPITLLGEVRASFRTGELRVSLTAWNSIRHMDLKNYRFPRVVIRRSERPIRFWFYQGVYVFFALTPVFLVLFLLYMRASVAK